MDNEYMKEYMQRRRRERRAWIITELGNECVICKSTIGLQADHIDPDTKLFELTGKDLDRKWSVILNEVYKCQLLCYDHHLEKSRKEGSLSKIVNKIENPKHGTSVMYGRLKCRCAFCKDWKRAYRTKKVDSLGKIIIPG